MVPLLLAKMKEYGYMLVVPFLSVEESMDGERDRCRQFVEIGIAEKRDVLTAIRARKPLFFINMGMKGDLDLLLWRERTWKLSSLVAHR